MRLKVSLLSIAVLILALMVGQVVLASQAEQSTQDTIELVGPVQTINADGSIVVNGVTVTITTAEINVALTTGQMVKVEGTLLADGRIAAREVRAPGVDDNDDDIRDDDEIELIGTVESYDGTTLVVNGIVIDLSGAEIDDPIVVGQMIKVHASFDANGNLIARETDDNLDDDDNGVPSPESTPEVGDDDDDNGTGGSRPGEFEITGTLQQVGDGFIVVNGQTIAITGAEIKNQLVVGALVKLHLSNQNGQWVAREVENARDDDDDDNDDNSGSSDDAWDEVYTVRPGDTLSSIAARAGVSVEELARINNITDTSIVIAGSRLIVPDDFDDDDGGSSGSSSDDDDNFDDNDDNDDNSGSGSGDDDDNFDDNDDDSSDDDNDDNSGSSDDDNDDDGGDDDNDDDSGDDDDGDDSGGDDDDD